MVNIDNTNEDLSMDVYFKSVNSNQGQIQNEFNLNSIELFVADRVYSVFEIQEDTN